MGFCVHIPIETKRQTVSTFFTFEAIEDQPMTANALKGDREMCLEAGMDDYITKPIKREVVFEALNKWVFNREA